MSFPIFTPSSASDKASLFTLFPRLIEHSNANANTREHIHGKQPTAAVPSRTSTGVSHYLAVTSHPHSQALQTPATDASVGFQIRTRRSLQQQSSVSELRSLWTPSSTGSHDDPMSDRSSNSQHRLVHSVSSSNGNGAKRNSQSPALLSPSAQSPSQSRLAQSQLRSMINSCLANHQFDTATFYADKLYSLTTTCAQSQSLSFFTALSTLYTLVDCYHRRGEYRRVIHALRQRSTLCPQLIQAEPLQLYNVMKSFVESDDDSDSDVESSHSDRALLLLRVYHLLSLSLYALHEYEEALQVLGLDDDATLSHLDYFQSLIESPSSAISAVSLYCCHRGQIYESQQNRLKCIDWYTRALQIDVRCQFAFDRLCEARLMSGREFSHLYKSLTFTEDTEWLALVYQNQMAIIVQNTDIDTDATTDTPTSTSISSDSVVTDVLSRLKVLVNSYGLQENLDLYASYIAALYRVGCYRPALTLSSELLLLDAYHPALLKCHILLLYQMRKKSELFYFSSLLTKSMTQSSLAWFSVGCYYLLIGKVDLARKHFSHSTALTPILLESWIGFASTYTLQEETEQAMIAYRTAMRMFEGAHEPLMGAGIEAMKNGNGTMGLTLLLQARRVCANDPLIYHECGVAHYKQSNPSAAIEQFIHCLRLINDFHSNDTHANVNNDSVSELAATAWLNLGHCYRKLGQYREALAAYHRSMGAHDRSNDSVASTSDKGKSSMPRTSPTGSQLTAGVVGAKSSIHRQLLTSIGFTHHLVGELDQAIRCYHEALATAPRDTLTQDLLNRALTDSMEVQPVPLSHSDRR